ncbi:hypothetical protein FD754_011270, partial [Muntiacus muntjak]
SSKEKGLGEEARSMCSQEDWMTLHDSDLSGEGRHHKREESGNALEDGWRQRRLGVAAGLLKNPPAKAGDVRDVGSVPELARSQQRRAWQPTPVSLPGEPHGQRSLAGDSPWGHKDMRRQNDRILIEELPRSVGAQHATGDQWRNNSRKNEGMEPQQKQYPVVDVTGDRSKVGCCKEQYCIGSWNVRSMNQGKLEVVKQEMARVNVDILGISELKRTGMGEFNSDDHYIYYCRQESLRRNGVAIMVNRRVQNAVLGCNLKNYRMISVHFQGKPFNITVIQAYAPTSNAEEAEVEWFFEDLQDLLELTPQKDVLFMIGDWNAKVGSQETRGVTGKFGLGVWNEAGQRLVEFCQENALVIANTLFQQHKRRLYTWTSPDGQHRNQIDYILCSQRWRCCIQSAKTRLGADCGSDHELLIAKFRLKLKKVGKTTRPFSDIVQETGIKTIPMEKKCKKAKLLSEEALQTAVKGSEKQRKKGKIFPFECREKNRMGKTRDVFKKIRDTKGTFHAKMGSIKDRNGNPKECSNYCTIALISHASKVMLKILQARLQ